MTKLNNKSNKIKNDKLSNINEFTLVDSAGRITNYTYQCKMQEGKHLHE